MLCIPSLQKRPQHTLNTLPTAIQNTPSQQQGDLLVHLLEGAHDELCKPAAEVSRGRLRALLEHAARTSSIAADPRADHLQFAFDARGLAQLAVAAFAPAGAPAAAAEPARPGLLMRGGTAPAWQVLLLDVRPGWPLGLVVPRRQLLQYQALSKHLFLLKFAERQLGAVWAALQPTRALGAADQARMRPWHALCRGLAHVLQEYLRFVTTDVLEPLWLEMEGAARRARDVEEVARRHAAFLLRAADGALLTQLPVLKCVLELQRCAHDLWREAAVLNVRGDAAAGAGAAGGAAGGASAGGRAATSGGGSGGGARGGRGGASAAGARSGSSGGGGRGAGGFTSFERALAALREVARDDAQAAAIAALSARFEAQLAELTERLSEHYQRLLAGGGGGSGANGAGAASSSSSTREELDSLLNLIERIDVGGRRRRDGVAAALAGVRLAAV